MNDLRVSKDNYCKIKSQVDLQLMMMALYLAGFIC